MLQRLNPDMRIGVQTFPFTVWSKERTASLSSLPTRHVPPLAQRGMVGISRLMAPISASSSSGTRRASPSTISCFCFLPSKPVL